MKTDFYTLFTIIVLMGFVFFVILRQLGPTQNKRIIDDSIELLERKLGGARGAYVPESRRFEAFQGNCTDPELLRYMAEDILAHCGIVPADLAVETCEEEMGEHPAGTYSHRDGVSTIRIRVSRYARYNVVLAVLIHECMHYYLRHSGIGFSETRDNEILTDTATIYMGFYEYIYHGYIMVGYLRDSEIMYVKKKLAELRNI
ncbi:MAG: hypothetical protein IK115_12000 [Lachnospiraceae bacterium]|nr:hypothetical protein [Lachnospiraceae bacterium]